MKLSSLKNTSKRQSRKRVGRGPGNNWGRTCGRGEKGQMSRSGASHRPYFSGGQMPYFRRLPKRGFKSMSHKDFALINVVDLEKHFEAGETVTAEALQAKHLITSLGAGLKILGSGEISKALTVVADAASQSAIAKIEAAGGKITFGE
ncbi:MAG: 50S ribosomal protein L15 [Lentisphaeria bacterium]|nr:50S ribosomal protein L15 [Lentisphaeria bacterium]